MWPPRSAEAWTRRGLLGALAAAAAAAAAAPARAEDRVHRIVIARLAFGRPGEPLRVGDVVEWENQDIFQHTVTARDGAFDLVLEPKASGRVVLRRAGKVQVYCRYHPGMTLEFDVSP